MLVLTLIWGSAATYFTKDSPLVVFTALSGDSFLGYHLSGTQFNNDQFDAIENSNQYGSTIPNVVISRSTTSVAKSQGPGWLTHDREHESTAVVKCAYEQSCQELEQTQAVPYILAY